MTEKDLDSYLYLQIFCETFNDFNGGFFTTGFCFLLVSSSILFIFIALTSYHVVNILIYLMSPALAMIMIGLILLFVPQDAKIFIKSRKLLDIMRRRPLRVRTRWEYPLIQNEGRQREWMRKRLQAFRALKIEISFFGAFSLSTPAGMMDQLFNNIILLLSL